MALQQLSTNFDMPEGEQRRVEFESLDVIGRQHRSPFCLLAFSYFPSYLDDVYVVLIYSGSCSPSVAACLLLRLSLSLSLAQTFITGSRHFLDAIITRQDAKALANGNGCNS